MEVTVSIDGVDRLDNATGKVRESIAAELAKAMLASVAKVEKEAKVSIAQGQKTGRTYKRGGVTHQASGPGEAPANDTGLLLNSIRPNLDKASLAQGQLEGTVTVGASYGKHLEFGTRTIRPRPFLFPAFERSKDWIRERLNKAVRDGVLKVTKP